MNTLELGLPLFNPRYTIEQPTTVVSTQLGIRSQVHCLGPKGHQASIARSFANTQTRQIVLTVGTPQEAHVARSILCYVGDLPALELVKAATEAAHRLHSPNIPTQFSCMALRLSLKRVEWAAKGVARLVTRYAPAQPWSAASISHEDNEVATGSLRMPTQLLAMVGFQNSEPTSHEDPAALIARFRQAAESGAVAMVERRPS